VSQSLPNQVNDFNGFVELQVSAPGEVSQSLPNQVNDFNTHATQIHFFGKGCRNPFQTRSTTSIGAIAVVAANGRKQSQSLPNQVNDFNYRLSRRRNPHRLVAIPSKPGQRLQSD